MYVEIETKTTKKNIMNINENFNSDENLIPNAETAMAMGMDFIFEKLIHPAEKAGSLSLDDIKMLNVIGLTFKTIAQEADSVEKVNLNDPDYFSRN